MFSFFRKNDRYKEKTEIMSVQEKKGDEQSEEKILQPALVKCLCETQSLGYLTQLAKAKECLIIVAVKDTSGLCYNSQLDEKMKCLGFSVNLINVHWCGYIGILDNKEIIFESLAQQNEGVSYKGIIGKVEIEVRSSPLRDENIAEIILDGMDYALNERGINIVTYDKSLDQVVDSVCLDTHVPQFTLTRLNIKFPNNFLTDQDWLSIRQREIFDEVTIMQKSQIKYVPHLKINRSIVDKRYDYRKKILLSNLFPDIFNKIEVKLFFNHNVFFWNCVKSLIKAFINDSRFHICVIFLDKFNLSKKVELCSEIGADYLSFEEYDLEQDRPDVTIMTLIDYIDNQYLDFFKNCGKYSNFSVVLTYTLVGYYKDFALRAGEVGKVTQKYGFDYCFWDSLVYKKLKTNGYDICNCIEMGNPKFDAIYEKLTSDHFLPDEWEKFRGKTVFLWATDHEWESYNCTFDQYAKIVFRYFYNHPEVGLIFRPHPVYIDELRDNHLWTQQEMDQLKSYFSYSPNMIWDENSDYSLAYDTADAIITDVECGVTVSALATKKPLCVFFRMGVPKHMQYPELIDNLYQVQSEQECIEFFEMIQRGEDPMKEQREQAFHNCICNFDGKNGQRMKDFIAEKYFEKYGTPENQE